jgi:guanylate kinase
MRGRLFVISAPSGTGKSTVLKGVRSRVEDVGYSVSHTTRSPRPGEREGRDYFFVDRKTFEGMIKEGAFVEWAHVYDDLYGTSFSSLHGQMDSGLDVLLDLDTQGAGAIKAHFQDCLQIFLLPPSLEVLERRLRGRGTDEQGVIEARLRKAVEEISRFRRYDYVVVNDDLERAINDVQAIILSERCRVGRREVAVRKRFRLE